MRFSYLWLGVSAFLLLSMVLYFLLNPSYERSLEAKVYFTLGKYDKAQALATEAFELNQYNRMAATIMTQSQVAMKFVNYNKQAQEYMKRISVLVDADSVNEAARAKIRTMCIIMMDEYMKISPSVVIDASLVEEAKHYYEKFAALYEKVT